MPSKPTIRPVLVGATSADPPDADEVYAHYPETCRRLGVEPVPLEHARKLMREWAATFERGGEPLH
jgi:hypothetical protein